MYAMTTQIGFTDAGKDGSLQLERAVGMMMNSCQFQEYQETNFRNFLDTRHLTVFLFFIQLDILRLPKFRETVTTAVRIYGCRSVYGLRRITIRDEQGKLCLMANAGGAFFDAAAGRAVKLIPEELGVRFDEAEPMETLPRKIPIPLEGGISTTPVPVTPSRLDPNGHLTSAAYASIAQDALRPDFTFNRLRLEYKKQVRPGENVLPVRYDIAPDKAVVDLCVEDGSCAAAEFSTADLTAEKDL